MAEDRAAPAVGGDEDAGEAGGVGGAVAGGLEFQDQGALVRGKFLRGGVIDQAGVVVEVDLRGQRRAGGGGSDPHGESVGGAARGDRPAVERLGQVGEVVVEEPRDGHVGLGLAGGDRQRELELGVAGHADFAAHEPVGLGIQRDGRAGGQVGGRGDFGEKEYGAFIAVAGHIAAGVLHHMRRGPHNRAGGETGGQGPLDRGGIAGARVDPVTVPVFIVLELEGDPERLPGLDALFGRDQGGFHRALAHGARHHGGEPEGQETEDREQREAKEFHPWGESRLEGVYFKCRSRTTLRDRVGWPHPGSG